jgi:hypothetical protein
MRVVCPPTPGNDEEGVRSPEIDPLSLATEKNNAISEHANETTHAITPGRVKSLAGRSFIRSKSNTVLRRAA